MPIFETVSGITKDVNLQLLKAPLSIVSRDCGHTIDVKPEPEKQCARMTLIESGITISVKLKQLAKDYNIFISSSTQVNANAMLEEGFKNESCIRGSRAIVDKADMGCIISRVDDKEYESLQGRLANAARMGVISDTGDKPTHVIDIYKMRRGQYKNVRSWCKIDLGMGARKDLYMIRPMIFACETDITRVANKENVPIVKSECHADEKTNREDTKNLLAELEKRYPALRQKIIGGMQRGDISGWGIDKC